MSDSPADTDLDAEALLEPPAEAVTEPAAVVHDPAAERYCRAVASVEGLAQGESGWLPNNDKTRALLERELIEEVEPPA